MQNPNKLLLALGAIALSAVVATDEADAQDYQGQCEWLSQRSAPELEQFIKDNVNDPCAEVAALLLVERTQPAGNARSSAVQGRY